MTQNIDPLADGIALQRALMASASTDNISPKYWWDRATSALETAAAAADDWPSLITKACRKLQIDVLSEASSITVADLSLHYATEADFEEFRSFVQKDAIFITAIHRANRAAEKAAAIKEKK